MLQSFIDELLQQNSNKKKKITITEENTFSISRSRTSTMTELCVSSNDGVFGVRVGLEVLGFKELVVRELSS